MILNVILGFDFFMLSYRFSLMMICDRQSLIVKM